MNGKREYELSTLKFNSGDIKVNRHILKLQESRNVGEIFHCLLQHRRTTGITRENISNIKTFWNVRLARSSHSTSITWPIT